MISRNCLPVAGAIVFSLMAAACGGGSPTSPGGGVEFTGVWQGSWQRTSCSETGGAVGNACSQTPASGVLRQTLTQTGSSVAGNVEFGTVVIPATGSVNAGGALSLTGQTHFPGQVPGTFSLSNWNTTRSGNTMNGGFTITFLADDPALGSQTLQITLQNVTKSS